MDPQLAINSNQDEEGLSCVRSVKLDGIGLTEGVKVHVYVVGKSGKSKPVAHYSFRVL